MGESLSMGGSYDCVMYIGSEDGMFVYLLNPSNNMKMAGRGLQGNAVRAIAVHPQFPNQALIGCGLRGWGLYRTDDYGANFRLIGFADQWVWDVVHQRDNSKVIWVGTEPPMIYKSEDYGSTFMAMNGIEHVPSRKQWKFFHPPFYGGHIHGIAFHPERPGQVLAGVEQGALLYSNDNGESWGEALTGYDLHRIAYDPSNPEHVLAGAGEGLLQSHDSGNTWNMIPEMKGKYVHGIAFDSFHVGRVYIYADDEHSPLYRSDDGGATWHSIGKGLPTAKPSDNLALHPSVPNVLFYAGDITNRESIVYCSLDAGESWLPISDRLPKIWRLKVAPIRAFFFTIGKR